MQSEVPRTGNPQPESLPPGFASPIIWKPSIPGPSSILKYNILATITGTKHAMLHVTKWAGQMACVTDQNMYFFIQADLLTPVCPHLLKCYGLINK